jgi:hypothetical protein
MSAATIPALIAASGGSLLLGGIYAHEYQRVEVMRRSRVRHGLQFPINLGADRATSALASLSALREPCEFIAELTASEQGITHGWLIPQTVADSVMAQLSSLMPGLRTAEAVPSTARSTIAVRLYLPSQSVLRTEDAEVAARTLLAGLAALHGGESVVLRWALSPATPRRVAQPEDPAKRADWRTWDRKTGDPGFAVAGLLLVRAGTRARAKELAEHVVACLRSRRGALGELRPTSDRSGRSMASLPRVTRSSGWLTVAETIGLLGWPLGNEAIAGVESGGAREIPVPRGSFQDGRPLFLGRDAGRERLVGISAVAATHHQLVVGPSGVGKSSLLVNCILSDLARGHGGVLIDPKSDLAADVIDRIPPGEAGRVVILDPAAGGLVPGVDVFAGGDPDLAADVILGALASIYRDSYGIRSQYYGRLGVRTLATLPGGTLADLGRLFYDPSFRRQAIKHLDDPILVGAWQQYDTLGAAEQTMHVQPFLTKAMSLLSRPAVRSVLAAREPKLDIGRLLADRGWLIISLSPGQLGEAAAQLLGAVLLYSVWAAVEARAALLQSERHPVYLYVDELATMASLPFSFELLAERARGLGCGIVVAAQTLGRIPESTRAALLGNAATIVSFRASADEAARLSRELPGITAGDLQALRQFEVAARLGGGAGAGVTTATGRTLPPPPSTRSAPSIRRRSAERYGSSPQPAVDNPDQAAPDGPVGRKRRTS